VTTGLGPFYDGVSHLLLSPDDLLGVLGLALFAGLGGARCGRLVLFTLPSVWVLGGLLGGQQPTVAALPAVSALSFVVIGALVAADLTRHPALVVGLAVVFGLVHGYLNGAVAAQGNLGCVGLLGIATTVFVLVALLAACTVSLRAAWARVAVRVAGSWIAAVGLLMLGWALR
jgi:hydrogenase/urease accessory protein HupE